MFYQYSSAGQSFRRFPGGSLGCLIAVVLVCVGLYYLLQGLYHLLLWAAPALLVLALIINWRVFPNTLNHWVKTLETNPLSALLSLALAVVAFPFFALYLFLKALGYRKMEQLRQQFGEAQKPRDSAEYAEFEEIESTPKQPSGQPVEDLGEPPAPPEKQPRKKDENPYDTFFEG
jgi:hypothetical protein